MHPALAIPEIIAGIFFYIPMTAKERPDDWPPYASPYVKKSHLPALAKVCKAFRSPALDFIWESLWGLEKLLELLPKHALVRDNRGRIVDIGVLSHDDWFAIFNHTSRVRNLNLIMSVDPSPPYMLPFITRLASPPLTVGTCGFPRLRNLCLRGSDLNLLGFLPLCSLEGLYLSVTEYTPMDPAQIATLRRDALPNLTKLKLSHKWSGSASVSGIAVPTNPREPPVTLGTLRLLTSFAALEHLKLDLPHPIVLTDADLECIARAWPRLKTFELNRRCGWGIPHSLITVDGLIAVARYCPHITSLAVTINSGSIGEPKDVPPYWAAHQARWYEEGETSLGRNTSLTHLALISPIVPSCVALGLLLASLFKNVTDLEAQDADVGRGLKEVRKRAKRVESEGAFGPQGFVPSARNFYIMGKGLGERMDVELRPCGSLEYRV
ncbi:hypothetical protein CONPUDRAFT_73852 [Coniophora puteana RWD-64-598 SS2]|uniref:F-box domain-containing protein n=1 Tax=Coniophora puteana (strain RWD-64-598) TaxID=741705 RepID=A0A5M3MNT4_CONPW|nr:uncharacterized protein CONPUDRAFT_73852 [Coniophora puteana RWD-64-598 SS2]EIW80829.1 hypothetical protein CONPUDRAFT_73852 [Coniophora puteana RWD-64-598 SS2]